MKSVLFALVVLLSAATCAPADDFTSQKMHNWPQWRGPLASGAAPEADPPLEWSEEKNIKWKIKAPGDTTATPIVWEDKVFLVGAVATDRTIELPEDEAKPKAGGRFNISRPTKYHQFVVACLDRASGKTLWQQTAKEEVPHEGHHPDGSFASASPTTDGQRLYVSFGSRGVYCYDLAGKQLWSRDFGKMKITFTFGEGTSPVVHGDTVIVNWDHQDGSFLVALDAKTGENRWKVERDETTTWATPIIVDYGGRTQVIVHGSKRVRSYDLASGELIWACGGQTPSAIPSPVTDGTNVYCMSGYIGSAVYAIPLDTVGDITEFAKKKEPEKIAWKKVDPGAPYVPSPLLDGDLLYYLHSNRGVVTCLNSKTGEPLIDRKRLEGISNIYASPVGAGDKVYFTGRDGTTVVVKKGPELEILATNKLDGAIDGSLALVGNEIFLRSRENLYCISAK